MAAQFQFYFIADTNQGPLLSYSRQIAVLDVGEQLDYTDGNNTYIHFTVKDANFNKTGDESNAESIQGIGFVYIIDGEVEYTFPLNRFTYYTNGAFKECYFEGGSNSGPFTVYKGPTSVEQKDYNYLI